MGGLELCIQDPKKKKMIKQWQFLTCFKMYFQVKNESLVVVLVSLVLGIQDVVLWLWLMWTLGLGFFRMVWLGKRPYFFKLENQGFLKLN